MAGKRVWIDHTSELNAPADEVEALLTDIDGWSRWTPGLWAILRRERGAALRVGSRFMMVLRPAGAPPVALPCAVLQLTPGLIEWGGIVGNGEIRHRFEIEARAEGGCRVRHVEFATGWLARIARPIERIAYRHDLGWSRAIEARFGA